MAVRLPRTLGDRLLAIREIKNLTLPALGDRCGVSKATISRLEREPNSNYTAATIDLIAAGLEVDSAYFSGAAIDLVQMAPRQVASSQGLIRFLANGSFTARERRRFARIQNHPAAPVTVQGWRDFWALLRGFFGRGPLVVIDDPLSSAEATLLSQTRREMLRVSVRHFELPTVEARHG